MCGFDCPKTLYSLVPGPILFNGSFLTGKMFISGNLAENALQFRFEYAPFQETAPILIKVQAAGKLYRYYCSILSGNSVWTPVFHPEFCVGQEFHLFAIEPIIQFLGGP